MISKERKAEIIAAAAEKAGIPNALIESLLALEDKHSNLHAWGAAPALRRAAAALIDAAMKGGEGRESP